MCPKKGDVSIEGRGVSIEGRGASFVVASSWPPSLVTPYIETLD